MIFLCSLACSTQMKFSKFSPFFSTAREAEKEKLYHRIHNFVSHCMNSAGKVEAPWDPKYSSPVGFVPDFSLACKLIVYSFCLIYTIMANKTGVTFLLFSRLDELMVEVTAAGLFLPFLQNDSLK